ncbi:hypothetical protein E4U37_003593 [Claviceps purpurea]|nr:hypothetical protein E4U37_003593 [Claviceps purpurea]
MINQFRTQVHVRLLVVRQWLRHLEANQSGYGDITIDEEVLSRLPDNGDVNAEIQTEDVNAVNLGELIPEIENDAPRRL